MKYLIAATIALGLAFGPFEAQAQTATPTATATPTVTPTPTLLTGYAVDSFPRYSVNCFRLEGAEAISCLPGTPVPQ